MKGGRGSLFISIRLNWIGLLIRIAVSFIKGGGMSYQRSTVSGTLQISFIILSALMFLAATDYDRTFFNVYKIRYKGDVGELNGMIVRTKDSTVAMASEVLVKSPQMVDIDTLPPAIFFIIDNSSSMSWTDRNDQWGSRFRVTHDLIDTINKKFGSSAEVGVSVFHRYLWYNPVNDSRFVKCPQYDTGAYIPLCRLNQSYPPDGKTGYDLLKFYTDTAMYAYNSIQYVDTKYQPDPPWPNNNTSRSTNINAAFDCAKDAFKNSSLPRNRQFIIFLSDGEANVSQIPGVTPTDYVKGTGCPTTFTVYFTQTGQGLTNLKTMTENIKKNGYSSKNPSSNLWNINTNYEKLMQLLKDSVLNVIAQSTQSKPVSLTINNIVSTNWNAGTKLFTFNNLFPLTGEKTDFTYAVKYLIIKDSANVVVQKDSIGEGKFTILIENGVNVPDTFELRFWMREIGFYYNNASQQTITDAMKQVELRFNALPGTAMYNYSSVPVELTTAAGNKKDKETFTLVNKLTCFSYTFPVAVGATASQGDKTLQVQSKDDTIYAVFRNNESVKLPLDTLKIKIPFTSSGDFRVTDGYYHDKTGDGFIDNIILKLDRTVTQDQAKEIVEKITFPAFRKFNAATPKNPVVVDTGIVITVSQDKAGLGGEPTTYVTDDDFLKVAQTSLNSGGVLIGDGKVPVHDRIAPIIMSASATVDNKTNGSNAAKDTLKLIFSEKVKPIAAPDPFKPFYCIRHDGNLFPTTYGPTLTQDNSNTPATEMTFTVEDFNNAGIKHFIKSDGAAKNDSIWISWLYNYVGDESENYQRNETNTRRLIDVKVNLTNIQLQIQTTQIVIGNNNINSINNTIFNTIVLDPVNIQNILNQTNNINLIIQINLVDVILNSIVDSLTGTLTIYDPLGNTLLKNEKMGYDKIKKKLNFVWNERNLIGRYVGCGAYMAVARVEIFQQGTRQTRALTTLIGVSR